ncbi:hypothetical protein B566_EDAN002061 [Ephemera danica]|nr:hypothetical protein B566_EDAN002061 [Ephemera danica]
MERDYAIINLPANLTNVPIHKLRQPPWTSGLAGDLERVLESNPARWSSSLRDMSVCLTMVGDVTVAWTALSAAEYCRGEYTEM